MNRRIMHILYIAVVLHISYDGVAAQIPPHNTRLELASPLPTLEVKVASAPLPLPEIIDTRKSVVDEREKQVEEEDINPDTATNVASQPKLFVWDEEGYASWYGGRFQGRKTANGEIFDTNELTAAHKTLPFDTIVRVYNPANEKSVLVRINDRGPFVEERIIDLSRAAANQIGLTSTGISKVQLQVVHRGEGSDIVTIQIGSFSQYENAIDLVGELEGAGFIPHIENVDDALFRVVITNVKRLNLDAMRNKLAMQGYSDVLIRAQKNR